jgi:Hemerythrin HHE cation binding domain
MSGKVSLRALDDELERRADCLLDAARDLPGSSLGERGELRARVLRFLRHDVGEHIVFDQHVLHPTIAARLGDRLAAAPLNYEHAAIRWWSHEIARADLADTEELQRLLYGLHAVIRLHLSREEDLYVGALESPVWPAAG